MKSMEGKEKLFHLLSHGTGHVQVGGVTDRAAAEAWRSGVLHKLLAETSGMSCFHLNYPDHSSGIEQHFDSKDETVSLGLGEVFPCPYKRARLNTCVSESTICPASFSGESYSAGTCAFSKTYLTKTDSTCCNTKIPDPMPDKLEVHMSESCQKKYVMFDHSGSKKRIIFHPSMLGEMSNLIPSNLSGPRNHLNHLQDLSGRAVCQLKETMEVNVAEGRVTLPACNGGLHSDHGACFKTTYSSRDLQVVNECQHQVQFNAAAEVETSVGSGNRVFLDCSNVSHENTDLEALMSSDDEISTGHSPSDGTWNEVSISSDNDRWGCDQAKSIKKRKRGVIEFCNGDDTCSTATSSEVGLKEWNCLCADTSHTGSGSFGLGAAYSEGEVSAFDIFHPDEESSKSSAAKHGLCCVKESGYGQPCVFLSVQPESAKTARRSKIKDTFKLLRGIIPGGSSMDAGFVLDETIQYVKSLQVQVNTQKCDARGISGVM